MALVDPLTGEINYEGIINQPTRKLIILRLKNNKVDFGYNLARDLMLRSPTVYEHLGILEKAGLVTSFKKKRKNSEHEQIEVFYRLSALGQKMADRLNEQSTR